MRYSVLHFILLIILFLTFTIYANDTLWTRTFGGTNIDVAYDIQQTRDSGYVITGYTRSYGGSGWNVWLIKTDVNGNEQWNKTFGGSGDEAGYSVKQTKDDGYIIAGFTKSFGAGLNDVYLIRTDASGNLKWSKTFGGAQDDEAYSVLQTPDGGFVIGGVTSSFAAGGRDLWMIKTDSTGNELWRRSHGALSSDGARCIEPTADGGFILTGWTMSFGTDVYGSVWLVKTDSSGYLQWHKVFGGGNADRGWYVKQTADGGYIVTGYTASFGAGNDDVYLIKTDDAGNERWSKTFGGSVREYGNCVQITADGGFIIGGYTLSFGAGGDDVWLIRTDDYGNELWKKTYGGLYSDQCNSVKETFDGSLIFTGHTLSYGAGVHDVWLVKVDGVVPVELVSFKASLINGNVHLSWTTATELNNRGFEIERRLSAKTEWERIGFIEGYGSTTDQKTYSFIDITPLPGIYYYRLRQIDLDGAYKYSDAVEVNLSTSSDFYLSQNYPNPFNPVTVIQWQSPTAGRQTLKVYDLLGNELAVVVDEFRPAGSYHAEFNASSLPSGMYFYKISIGEYAQGRKMMLVK